MISHVDVFLELLKKPIKQVFIKLEIYDSTMNYITEITQKVTKDSIGQLSIDSNRPIRRSFTITLDNSKGEFTWGENNLIFIDKRIRLYIGLKDPKTNQIVYVPQGVFLVSEPSDNHTVDGKTVTINCVDKMSLMTGNRGKLLVQTTIEAGTNVATAIKLLVNRVGITEFNFDNITETIPYELTYEPNTNIYDAISEIALLGKSQIYFDEIGYLRLKKIDLNDFQNYPPVWTYKYNDPNERFYAGNVRTMDNSNLANRIIVLGGSSQTAIASYDLKVTNTNPIFSDNPYAIERVGEYVYFHNNGNPDPLLTSSDGDCKWRAKFELLNRLGYSEKLSLSVSPLYIQDVHDVIEIIDDENQVNGRYLIESINIPLSPQLMTIECRKERRVLDNWDFI